MSEHDPNAIRIVDWEECWKTGKTQWDQGAASSALVKLLEERPDLVPSEGKGLVPGCGGGYDVVLLATKDRHMTGLDMSPTCIEQCKKSHAENKGNFDFVCDDFYTFKVPEGGYDLVYDYTFLCAMLPEMRPKWAARMAEIIKPGGTLVALIFPIVEKKGGPPFAVTPQLYMDLLSENFDNVYLEDAQGHESRLGSEKMSVWKRKN